MKVTRYMCPETHRIPDEAITRLDNGVPTSFWCEECELEYSPQLVEAYEFDTADYPKTRFITVGVGDFGDLEVAQDLPLEAQEWGKTASPGQWIELSPALLVFAVEA